MTKNKTTGGLDIDVVSAAAHCPGQHPDCVLVSQLLQPCLSTLNDIIISTISLIPLAIRISSASQGAEESNAKDLQVFRRLETIHGFQYHLETTSPQEKARSFVLLAVRLALEFNYEPVHRDKLDIQVHKIPHHIGDGVPHMVQVQLLLRSASHFSSVTVAYNGAQTQIIGCFC
eukprot:CAMPEP_0170582970 /NCGR_PEP_ID=MMETSP0224-20130122/7874_1 /TAXON_ID=285029 /ORGANISM="Togula jolla, Strain CCCM 725" /LENGTH=173 /DNA_ID=CAMNT_0010906243 /DNA_START=1029 /DNA_END=1551 /DNA_ORIENTATION=-